MLGLAFMLIVALTFSTPLLAGTTVEKTMIVYAQPSQGNQTANQTAPETADLTVDRPFYKPTKIVFNFPFTHEAALQNVSTVGLSTYKYDGTPVSFTFIAEDVDMYTFTLRLSYENATPRTCLIAVWQGNLPMEGYTLKLTGETTLVTFRLNLTEQPSYPTEQQVAQEVVHQIEGLIVTQIEENRRIQESNQNLILSVSIVTMIAMVCSVITLVLVLYWTGKVRRIRA